MQNELKILSENNLKMLEKNQEINREISYLHEKIRERALGHIYHLITVMGIVAGFGFTALDNVESLEFFFKGEFVLILSISVGIWYAKAGFIDEIKSLSNWIDQIHLIMQRRMELKFDGTMSLINMRDELDKIKNDELKIFDHKMKTVSYYWFSFVFYSFIVGSILILISFLKINVGLYY